MNSYMAFLSFGFIFIMTQASQLFICTKQMDGTYTLNASPDINCLASGPWMRMLPLAIIIYVLFGVGAIPFFIYLYSYSKYLRYKSIALAKIHRELNIGRLRKVVSRKSTFEKIMDNNPNFDETETDKDSIALKEQEARLREQTKNFNMRFKFMLSRFKRKYFFWEAVVAARKLSLAILHTFLQPMLVVVFGIFIVFCALLLHMYAVPYRFKFHNLMEYVVLLCTLLTLFFGLLFFVDKFPTVLTKDIAIWLASIILIIGTILVACMIVWDFFTRRKKEIKKLRKRRQELQKKFGEMRKKELEAEYRKLFPSILSKMNRVEMKVEWIITANPLLEDPNVDVNADYEHTQTVHFAPPFYDSDEEIRSDSEENEKSLNAIMDNLFGREHLAKKYMLFNNKRKSIVTKIKGIVLTDSSEGSPPKTEDTLTLELKRRNDITESINDSVSPNVYRTLFSDQMSIASPISQEDPMTSPSKVVFNEKVLESYDNGEEFHSRSELDNSMESLESKSPNNEELQKNEI